MTNRHTSEFYSYREAMNNGATERIKGHALIAAITHDETRVWLLHGESNEPEVTIRRPEVNHVHARAGQERHGHSSEVNEVPYFVEVASVLALGSQLFLVGHGKGNSNTMNRLVEHLEAHNEPVLHRIVAKETMNIPALTSHQLVRDARRSWPQW